MHAGGGIVNGRLGAVCCGYHPRALFVDATGGCYLWIAPERVLFSVYHPRVLAGEQQRARRLHYWGGHL